MWTVRLLVDQSTGGGKNDIWMQASWSYNVNGMYQFAPDRAYGFNVAANIYGREGYPIPYFAAVNPGDGIEIVMCDRKSSSWQVHKSVVTPKLVEFVESTCSW